MNKMKVFVPIAVDGMGNDFYYESQELNCFSDEKLKEIVTGFYFFWISQTGIDVYQAYIEYINSLKL